MKIYSADEFVGFTPRLKEVIFGVVNAEPLPGSRTYEEKVEGLFKDRMVQKEVTPKGWKVDSVDYDRMKKEMKVGIEACKDAHPSRKKEIVISLSIMPFTLPQAAALGSETLSIYQYSDFGGGRTLKPPPVWWGTKEDLEEIQKDFPHLC